jgi:alanine dehydrogenase
MVIGVPKEIKNNEYRVGLTPGGVHSLAALGHSVLVEAGAGEGSGFADEEYAREGAQVLSGNEALFGQAEVIVKVKEPLEPEYALMRPGQALYTYLHLAANLKLTQALLDAKVTGIAYETVQLPDGRLPLLAPMSEVAGRLSVQAGAYLLEKFNGGRGVLLGGVPGVAPAEVVIVGGGVVGMNAARMAAGLGARVTVLDIDRSRLMYLDDIFSGRVTTLFANAYNIAQAVKAADLLIGAVLVAGRSAPRTVTEAMVKAMKKGAVIVDVAIDQGGSIETIDRVTTHDNPSYVKHGVLHYSVANMPGAVPRTSTLALEAATLPYLLVMAKKGVTRALLEDPALLAGLNTCAGKVTCKPVAESLGLAYSDPRECWESM